MLGFLCIKQYYHYETLMLKVYLSVDSLLVCCLKQGTGEVWRLKKKKNMESIPYKELAGTEAFRLYHGEIKADI